AGRTRRSFPGRLTSGQQAGRQAAKANFQGQAMEKRDLQIEVGDRLDRRTATKIAATVFIPDPGRLHQPPIVVFASPGGGYGRGYFDLPSFNDEAYSQAEHHVAAGLVVVAYDHLGVGDSTCPEDEELSNENIAEANDAAVRAFLEMLEKGKLSN